MHDVSNAINILDKNIDKKICTAVHNTGSNVGDLESSLVSPKCATKSDNSTVGLASVVKKDDSITGYTDTDKMGVLPKTSAQITKDISALNRDQKGIEVEASNKVLKASVRVVYICISVMLVW